MPAPAKGASTRGVRAATAIRFIVSEHVGYGTTMPARSVTGSPFATAICQGTISSPACAPTMPHPAPSLARRDDLHMADRLALGPARSFSAKAHAQYLDVAMRAADLLFAGAADRDLGLGVDVAGHARRLCARGQAEQRGAQDDPRLIVGRMGQARNAAPRPVADRVDAAIAGAHVGLRP